MDIDPKLLTNSLYKDVIKFLEGKMEGLRKEGMKAAQLVGTENRVRALREAWEVIKRIKESLEREIK